VKTLGVGSYSSYDLLQLSLLNGWLELELEFALQPTISRPVHLGIGAHDQILSFLFFFCLTITLLFFLGRPR
jgi:hypothetical protein